MALLGVVIPIHLYFSGFPVLWDKNFIRKDGAAAINKSRVKETIDVGRGFYNKMNY